MKKVVLLFVIVFTTAIAFFSSTARVFAAPVMLTAIQVTPTENNKVDLRLSMSGVTALPTAFALDNPVRWVFDFPMVKNKLDKNKMQQQFETGVVRRVSVVESQSKMRVIVELNQMLPYETKLIANDVSIMIGAPSVALKPVMAPSTNSTMVNASYSVKNIDFKRGDKQEGRIIIDLSDKKMPIDVKQEGNKMKLRFMNAQINEKLQRQLDVTDFGTPVKSITTTTRGADVEIQIVSAPESENISYQADNRFTVEVKPLSKTDKEALKAKKEQYTGERLSLNFQDIEVRAVLQLIAEFTGLNIVSSDAVKGSVTLRLRNVPWDQALDIILKTKGLDKRQMGNVLMVGPTEEIAAREKLDLQTHLQVSDLAPLKSEYMQVNYAKAIDLAKLLKNKDMSLLSARGNVSVDDRTNTLLVQDTAAKLTEVRHLIARLDVPIRQVLIESRVVYVTKDFAKSLGIRLGSGAKFKPGKEPRLGFAGNRSGADTIANLGQTPGSVSLSDRLNVNLAAPPLGAAATAVTSGFGLSIASLPGGTILDMELTALELEGLATVLANPRLITSNQQTAYIQSGEEIPYQEASSSGATSVSFKKAVLKLQVTPQITPDNNIILDLTVNQDARSGITAAGGIPVINTREMHTKVLVSNGETVVLGGIYSQNKSKTVTRIPVLGKLPCIGFLFRNEEIDDGRSELMIFVTPKILQQNLKS